MRLRIACFGLLYRKALRIGLQANRFLSCYRIWPPRRRIYHHSEFLIDLDCYSKMHLSNTLWRFMTDCKIAWNLLFINFKRFCHTISVSVYSMSITLYVLTSHLSRTSICVSIGPYMCLSHVQKPFYCLTCKMRWPTLTQNYKCWEWGKILHFEKKSDTSFIISYESENFALF